LVHYFIDHSHLLMMKPISTILFLLLLICFAGCNNGNPNPFSNTDSESEMTTTEEPKTPEELRAELRSQEELSPLEYITQEGVNLDPQQIQTRRPGLFHDAEYAPDGAIVSGSFRNTATLARFKDVQIKLKFYSVTNTMIDEKTYTIYEYIEPHSSTSFSFKIADYPDAMSSFRSEIVGATPVSE
jgi:hypothetical protein